MIKTPEDKADDLITWLREEADEGDIEDVYDYVTGKKELDLEFYRKYVERNMERIDRDGWVPVCFAEYLESEEYENDKQNVKEKNNGLAQAHGR